MIFFGCENSNKIEKIDLKFSDFEYDSVTKKLKLNFDQITQIDIESIEITTNKNLRQTVYLDSNKQISSLYNSVSLDRKRTFVDNTWYKFDSRGNLDLDYTFYYKDGTLVSFDKEHFYLTYIPERSLNKGIHYALIGDYDEFFQLKGKSKPDTIRIDPNEPGIKIPVDVENKKDGRYNIRFIVHEDKKFNDTIFRKSTYVDRDYFIVNDK